MKYLWGVALTVYRIQLLRHTVTVIPFVMYTTIVLQIVFQQHKPNICRMKSTKKPISAVRLITKIQSILTTREGPEHGHVQADWKSVLIFVLKHR